MRVLINRTDAIGDTLLSVPVAKLIKSKFPEAIVGFIVSPRSGDLINLCEGIDQVFIFDPKSNDSEARNQLTKIFKEFSPDSFFHLGGSFLPTKYAWKFKVPIRGGLKSRLASFFLLNNGKRQKRTLEGLHESHFNMELMTPLGLNYQKEEWDLYSPQLVMESKRQHEVMQELDLKDKKLVVVHPGMSGHTLNWSSENYGKLLERLASDERLHLMVSFTPSDMPYLEGLKNYLKDKPSIMGKIQFFDGSKKGLIHFAYVLSLSKLFVGPSTGTLHMANALNIPQIGIYSPIKAQAKERWAPYRRDEKVILFTPQVTCPENIRCAGKSCSYFDCMTTIEISQVYEACKKLLN